MAKSLFQRNLPEQPPPPNPYELIGPEIEHLRQATDVRHGPKAKGRTTPWTIVLGLCVVAGLYVMDPIMRAWYKGEAIQTYLYLHNYGSTEQADHLLTAQLLSPEEVVVLNHRQGSFQDYYPSPQAAEAQAETITKYMADTRLLHAGKYQQLGPIGRLRYLLFVRWGIYLPDDWQFLDPTLGG
jgi:hypothetical protein